MSAWPKTERGCYDSARQAVTKMLDEVPDVAPDVLAFGYLTNIVAGNYAPSAPPLGAMQLRGIAAGTRAAVVAHGGATPCRYCGSAMLGDEARAGFKTCEWCKRKGR